MDEQEIEQSLRRVQPAGPRPELRLAVRDLRRSRIMPWAAAAAALLAVALVSRAGSEARLHDIVPQTRDADAAVATELARAIGGGIEAPGLAAAVLAHERLRAAALPRVPRPEVP